MMMRVLIVVGALALAAPAMAQSPYSVRKPSTGYGAPATPSPSATRPSGYGTPPSASGGFKPYEGFKGTSVYSAPKSGASGAKPCETSVYVNACDKRR